MKASLNFLTITALMALTACSTEKIKPTPEPQVAPPAAQIPVPPPSSHSEAPLSGQNPAMTVNKAGKSLNLVRIMDGAACKNDFEGVKGTFLVYASPDDIARIKGKKGAKVFSDFETKIQNFSEDVLQHTVNVTHLAEDPFALGKDEAQEKLAAQLSANFRRAAVTAIAAFEKATGLTIDVAAYPPSLVFYLHGCEATLTEPDTSKTPAPESR